MSTEKQVQDIAARRESVPPYEATTNPDGSVTARTNLRFVPDAPQQVEDGLFASANRSLAAALRTGPLTAPLDPKAVKAGDTVTVRVEEFDIPDSYEVTGKAYVGPIGMAVGGFLLDGDRVTLTAHTPAPEPEPAPEFDPVLYGLVMEIANDSPLHLSDKAREEAVGAAERVLAKYSVIDPAAARKALEDNGWGEHETADILEHLGLAR